MIWDFTLADPRITIAGDGTGKLTAKIGYSFYGTKTAPEKTRALSDVVFFWSDLSSIWIQDAANAPPSITAARNRNRSADALMADHIGKSGALPDGLDQCGVLCRIGSEAGTARIGSGCARSVSSFGSEIGPSLAGLSYWSCT